MTERFCATHPRRHAPAGCVRCGRALCRQCIVSTGVGFKCPQCTGTSVSPVAQVVRGRPWTVATLALGLAVIAWAIVAAVGRGGAPEGLRGEGVGPLAADPGPGRVAVGFRGAGGLMLQGTLDVPAAPGHKPGVVIVPGFGGTTRDGISDGVTVTDPLYRDLGEALAAEGMVVLRYDKRGTGMSGPLPRGPELHVDQYVADAAAALAFLRGRPEVNRSQLAVIGHDEGGLVGLRLAADEPAATALVLVSTPGRPLVEVLAQEVREGGLMGSDEQREELAAELERAVQTVLTTGEVPQVSDQLRAVLPGNQPVYLQSIFSLDPAAEGARVRAPVLIVHGEQDPGIRDSDVEALQAALSASPRVEVIHAPQADHTLRLVAEGDHGHAGPGSGPTRRDTDTLRRIAAWLQGQWEPR